MPSRTSPLLRALALPLVLVVAACGAASSPSPSPVAATPEPATPSAIASPSADIASPAASPSEIASPSAAASGDTGSAVEIVGVEYAFENVPTTTEVGTAFSLRNGGQEAHEMVLVRKNEGVTESFEELLQLPEEEAFNFVTVVGQVMANPGETADGTLVAEEAGEYLFVCFFPVGLTEIPSASGPAASFPAGPPHFTQGMLAEFSAE